SICIRRAWSSPTVLKAAEVIGRTSLMKRSAWSLASVMSRDASDRAFYDAALAVRMASSDHPAACASLASDSASAADRTCSAYSWADLTIEATRAASASYGFDCEWASEEAGSRSACFNPSL